MIQRTFYHMWKYLQSSGAWYLSVAFHPTPLLCSSKTQWHTSHHLDSRCLCVPSFFCCQTSGLNPKATLRHGLCHQPPCWPFLWHCPQQKHWMRPHVLLYFVHLSVKPLRPDGLLGPRVLSGEGPNPTCPGTCCWWLSSKYWMNVSA